MPAEGVIGWFEMKVEKTIDFGTHTMFVASVTDSGVLDEKGEELTYAYYHSDVKPKPAPPAPASADEEVWVCRICGYVHRGPLPQDFVCPICKHGAQDFEKVKTVGSSADEIKENNSVVKGEKIMAKFRCTVCGYVHEGTEAPEKCPLCKAPKEKFVKIEEGERSWAAEHVIGVAKGVPADIMEGLKANFEGECTEVGMYLAMARAAHREGYPEIGLYWEKAAYEEAEHAAKFAELIGEVVSPSTKENLMKRVEAEKTAPPRASSTSPSAPKRKGWTPSTTPSTKWLATKRVTAKPLKDCSTATSSNISCRGHSPASRDVQGAPPLDPARGIMPLDPLYCKNAPSVADNAATLGAIFIMQWVSLAHPRNLFIARSSARFAKESRRKISLVGNYSPTPPHYCFIPLSCIRFVKELRRKISRATPR